MERILKNRFLVQEKLGEGPFRISYKAKDLSTGNPLVLKVFRRSVPAEKKLEHILGKLKTLQTIQDPLFPRFEDGDLGWEGFYIIREYIEGESLQERLARGGRITEGNILNWMARLSAGLQKAHDHGILHGAIHLKNILFTKDGDIKLVDFVVDPLLRESAQSRVKILERDPFFLSPEEVLGGLPTSGSDIYRMGILLFRLWTGRFPFEEGSAYQIALSIARHPVPQPSELNSQIPPAPAQMILRALAKNPQERFSKIQDFVEAIRTGVAPRTPVARELPSETEVLLQQLARSENGPGASHLLAQTTRAGLSAPARKSFSLAKILWGLLSVGIALVAAYLFYHTLFMG